MNGIMSARILSKTPPLFAAKNTPASCAAYMRMTYAPSIPRSLRPSG
jgi:hypothetical protein